MNNDKFYVVAERFNPQLGVYLNDAYVGKKRVNKCSITCTVDYYGSPRKIKFTLHKDPSSGIHWSKDDGNCVYGSMSYLGFDTAEEAKAYVEKNWASHHARLHCIEKLSA